MKQTGPQQYLRKIGAVKFLVLLLLPVCLSAQIIPAGSGSYTTQLPPADAAGRNALPNGTPRLSGAAATKPVVTNDWWTGLLTYNDANLYNYPLSMKGASSGLVVSYTFLGQGANDSRQPMGPEQPLVVGVSGLTGTYPTVSDYTDWTVTASWNNSGRAFNATMGMGMPFVYCTKGSSDIASVVVNTGTVAVQGEMLLITNSISGANFAVYAPVGSTWSNSGTTYTSTLAGKDYFSVAMLPAGVSASTAASDYKQYAYVFPGNTSVAWNYDNATSTMQSTFTITPDKKEGSGASVLLGLLPHQWAHLTEASAQPGSYAYRTSRGTMKMMAANSFVVENKFKGVLSALPNSAKYSAGFDPAALNSKIDLVKNSALDLWTDSYNEGLAMNKLVQVAKIADQMGNTAARDQLISTVKTRLENWLKATQGENAFVFYYNSKWTTLIGYPAGYSADANINDHHFHYANFINAAAAVEQFQPGWAASWGPMVDLLVKDVANWEKSNAMFPFLRNFQPYAGHSFASGQLNAEPHGNNQESSSEAMNFNSSLIHWGVLTGNTAIRDLGIYLYTTEQTAIEEYWFDMSDRNFAPTYSQMMCSRVWGNGYDRGTFWTGDIAAMYGIEMFPLTGSALYLGHNKTYAQSLWNDMKAKTGVLTNTPNDNLWFDTYWSFLAFSDPAAAVNLYNNYPTYKPKGGNSDAHTYHWLHSFNGMGTVEAAVTADYPIAAVFNKAGDKTYVAHNYGASEITVTYSDGFSMVVPARTMKTSKDIPVTASLSASATEVATNGSVNLTAGITGAGITKVEFYDGTELIATTTTAPYTANAANLAAKVHGFYAKVYVGTSLEISNVVSVVVGSQLPYQGTVVSIPSQVIEPGNYDYYDGGIGQNISYFDATTSNEAGTFRSPEYVDAAPTAGEGNAVLFINEGEWLEYTVNIAQAGAYELSFRYASGNTAGGGPFHIEVDGSTVADNIKVGFTNSGWTLWATKTVAGVILPAGQHVIRLAFDKAGFNIGKISFIYKGSASPSITVSSNTVAVEAFANSKKTIEVGSNVTWTAVSNQSWLTVSPASAFGDATLTMTAQENTTTATRVATVTLSGAGAIDQVVTVTQDAGGVPYLQLTPGSMDFLYKTNTARNISITSNVAWTATSDQTWLTLSAATGSGIAVITASAADYAGMSNRTATITITGNGLPAKTIAVTQNGAPIVITLPINFESEGTYVFTDFDGGLGSVIANPYPTETNPSNKVGKVIRNTGATWAGSYLTLNNKINLSSLSAFSMKVYSARAGVPVLLKLEGDVGPSEILATTTQANAWETLRWNFTGKPSNVYNKLVLMFDFGTVGNGSANSTFFFDDIAQISSALPVKLTAFSAVKKDRAVALNWQTATETNNRGFAVERSRDGQAWSEINFVKAAADNGSGSQYASTDLTPAKGMNYYRLRQMDLDGRETYSAVKLVTFNDNGATVSIYPNPASGIVHVTLSEVSGKLAYSIVKLNGKTVMRGAFSSGRSINTINVSHLPAGAYLINFIGDQFSKSEKLMLK